jgi:hypothetical protein
MNAISYRDSRVRWSATSSLSRLLGVAANKVS